MEQPGSVQDSGWWTSQAVFMTVPVVGGAIDYIIYGGAAR